jgi:hypothetical protein
MASGKRGRAATVASGSETPLVYGLTEFESTLVRDALANRSLAELAAARHVSATAVAAELRVAVQKLLESVAQPSGNVAVPIRYMRRGALVGAIVDRQAGERGLKAAMARATRTGSSLSVVYLSWRLDDDRDAASGPDDAGTWRRIGYLVANNVRPDDLCIRWSDTAALVVLEHTTESQAHIVARRLGQAEEGANLGIGVAERAVGEDVPRLVHRAGGAASKMLLDLRAQRRLSSGYRI